MKVIRGYPVTLKGFYKQNTAGLVEMKPFASLFMQHMPMLYAYTPSRVPTG